MARLLTSLEIPCGHEAVFDWRGYLWAQKRLDGQERLQCSNASTMQLRDGHYNPIPEWVDTSRIVAESSYMAAPFLRSQILRGTSLVHVVRNPVDVINSFCNYLHYFQSPIASNTYEQFIYRHVPDLRGEMSQYARAAMYYVEWNRMIEAASPAVVFRIEDAPTPVLSFLGKSGNHFDDRTVNTQKQPGVKSFSVDRLPDWARKPLVEMAERYGYKTTNIPLL